jgi:hypothetical protein
MKASFIVNDDLFSLIKNAPAGLYFYALASHNIEQSKMSSCNAPLLQFVSESSHRAKIYGA